MNLSLSHSHTQKSHRDKSQAAATWLVDVGQADLDAQLKSSATAMAMLWHFCANRFRRNPTSARVKLERSHKSQWPFGVQRWPERVFVLKGDEERERERAG